MIAKWLELVKGEFRSGAAYDAVSKLASHHRVQCSPGFRDAARYIADLLCRDGIAVRVLEYPAKKGEAWWSQESFPEWLGKDAELILLDGGKRLRLCSFAEEKISLVQRSAPTLPKGLRTTMVYVEKGEDAASYEGMDVKGKIVFTRGRASEVAAVAVDKFGAAGIAVDNMMETPLVRDRFTLPDGRQYQSFWPADADAHKAFGFMLTPRQGEALRRLFLAGKKELEVFARVDSAFFDGKMEVVEATIPGETQEEVVAIAHLCHPEPSANDNASGCGALAEGVKTIHRLVESGRLPKPGRTIRFLWVAEMTGSYAYLASREKDISRFVAAINLDMVGQNQDLCRSTFTVERPVAALPGFGGDLAEAILRMMTKQSANLGATHSYSTFRWTVGPYSGGSDHFVWGDPTVGVTCPMLIQWPDRFYHTSEDTMDKVDPDMLALSGVLAASYLYSAASATPEDVAFLAGEAATNFAEEIGNALSLVMQKWQQRIAGAVSDENRVEAVSRARREIERRVGFLAARKRENILSLRRLSDESLLSSKAITLACAAIEDAKKYLMERYLFDLSALSGAASTEALPPAWVETDRRLLDRARSIVPRRRFRGPFSTMAKQPPPGYEEAQKGFSKKYPGIPFFSTLIEYWADGERSCLEIAEMVEGERGFWNLSAFLDQYELMVLRGIFAEGSDDD